MIQNNNFTEEQRAEIKEVVGEALVEFFKDYGLQGKNIIVTAAVVIGAIMVILGGLKTMLGWVGFSYMMKP